MENEDHIKEEIAPAIKKLEQNYYKYLIDYEGSLFFPEGTTRDEKISFLMEEFRKDWDSSEQALYNQKLKSTFLKEKANLTKGKGFGKKSSK